MDWQPIESAPKDGTRIIISVRYSDGERVTYLAEWDEHDDNFRPEYAELAVFNDEDSVTHWMPLPEAPAHG